MNARTATEADYVRISDLHKFVGLPEEVDELPRVIPDRHNRDMSLSITSTWGPELLELCRDTNLLILNGRIHGDLEGKSTYHSKHGSSTIEYLVASAQCMAMKQSLQVLEDMTHGRTDHYSVLLHSSCNALDASHHRTPPASTDAKFKYVGLKADAYQECLAHELHVHFEPLLGQKLMLTNCVTCCLLA